MKEQAKLYKETSKLMEIFAASDGAIRPHFIVTGPSGSGKSHSVKALVEKHKLGYLEINAAQLTKEGTSGNSLSKALAPLAARSAVLTVCFVDEFDKLFISGNFNSSTAHETTTGVQNEFLTLLESDSANVFGDYGKYNEISIKNVLFVFAGAFNGEEDITLDRLREFGVKTEFLGRVGLVYNIASLSLESMLLLIDKSELLDLYLQLFDTVQRVDVVETLKQQVEENIEHNTLGARLINNLIHTYFVGSKSEDTKVPAFKKTLELN